MDKTKLWLKTRFDKLKPEEVPDFLKEEYEKRKLKIKERQLKWSQNNIEKVKNKTLKRKKQQSEYYKKWRKTRTELDAKRKKEYYHLNKEKTAAQRKAIRDRKKVERERNGTTTEHSDRVEQARSQTMEK